MLLIVCVNFLECDLFVLYPGFLGLILICLILLFLCYLNWGFDFLLCSFLGVTCCVVILCVFCLLVG